MIYTITLNPGIDLQYKVKEFEYNTVIRSRATLCELGGKGFNVSHALYKIGAPSTALGFVGGRTGQFLIDQLERIGIRHDLMWVESESRINTTILQESGKKHIKVNEVGPTITPELQESFLAKAVSLADHKDWFIISGSLPPGIPDSYYARLIREVKNRGAYPILDSSGSPFSLGVQAQPFLAKPNRQELEQLTGILLDTIDKYLSAIKSAHQMGAARICITLGSQGAIFSDGAEIIHGKPPHIEEANPVAAGDALLAGIVAGLNNGWSNPDSLRFGIACGTAAASLEGTNFGSAEIVENYSKQVIISNL